MATRDELEALTVDDLKERARDADVAGSSSMRKADLVDALAGDTPGRAVTDDGGRVDRLLEPTGETGEETPTVAVPDEPNAGRTAVGIDPRLVEQREAARKARPDTRRGGPTPARIDPRLVERRDERRAAADEDVRPVTSPPARP